MPTLVYIIYQKSAVFDETGGIGFGLGKVWEYYQSSILLGIVKGIAFPIVVLCFNYKKLGSSIIYRFAWLQYAISFCEAYFLYEKGYRMMHFNFAWGYYYGMMFLFLASVIVLVRSDKKRAQKSRSGRFTARICCAAYCISQRFSPEADTPDCVIEKVP